jgi:hypothetical protein
VIENTVRTINFLERIGQRGWRMENKEMMLQPTASKQGCKGNGKVEEGDTLWDVG